MNNSQDGGFHNELEVRLIGKLRVKTRLVRVDRLTGARHALSQFDGPMTFAQAQAQARVDEAVLVETQS